MKLKFETPEDLKKAIDGYFEYCDKKGKYPCIAKLAYNLGISRQTLYNYEKKEQYSDIITDARNRIIASLEEEAIDPSRKNVSGIIFVMKNYGYSDKQIVEHSLQGEVLKKMREEFGL